MNKKERPILQDLVNAGTSKTERFQNEVIRPIIKMQHNLLIVFFQDYTKQRKIDFVNLGLNGIDSIVLDPLQYTLPGYSLMT